MTKLKRAVLVVLGDVGAGANPDTSADSVFQIAAHQDVIPLEGLYYICEIARGMLTGDHAVGRVIARPFIRTPGNFKRTSV